MAALGERERELGEPRGLSPDERAAARRQARRVMLWSIISGVAMTGAALLVRSAR